MRRFSEPRASTSVAIVASAVAILAVVFPGLGFGETISFQGGPPSNVFMNTETNVCNGDDKIGGEPVALLPTAVQVDQESDLLVYFTGTWSRPSGPESGLILTLQVEGESVLASSAEFLNNTDSGHDERSAHITGTVMWSFPDIAPGSYTASAIGVVPGFVPGTNGQSGVNVQACALTAFVMPVLE